MLQQPWWGRTWAPNSLSGRSVRCGLPRVINMILMGSIAIAFIAWPGFFIGLFISEPAVLASGISCLRIISYGFVAYALGSVVIHSFNGAGDTATPTFINLFCFWMFEIPLAYVLALPFGLNENGVYIAILAAETAMTMVGVLLFRRGRWKLREV